MFKYGLQNLDNVTKEDLEAYASFLENKNSKKKTTTASDKQLLKAEKLGIKRVHNLSKIQSKKVVSLAPIGLSTHDVTDMDIKPRFKANGQTTNYTPHNTKNLSYDERFKRGLSNRDSEVDYMARPLDEHFIKTCTCCNKTYNTNNFNKNKKNPDGFTHMCKDCDNRRKKFNGKLNQKLREEDLQNNIKRICTTCKCTKPIKQFSKAYSSYRGTSVLCKSCYLDKYYNN